jgi:hypothetical protein
MMMMVVVVELIVEKVSQIELHIPLFFILVLRQKL